LSGAIDGRYEFIEQIGKGAFGDVYKARDSVLGRTVAVKQIPLDRLGGQSRIEESRARFLREAQVAAQLHHPNIVTIYDVISMADMGVIIMEYVEGETLQDLLTSKKVLGFPETAHIVSQVADALEHAHEQKVVHRDIKPGNILVSPSGHVKVADFGIAKSESSADLTTAGSVLGTPDYMSPEQARADRLDGRSDLFSLGCIAYECLVGSKPFPANSMTEVLLRIINGRPDPIDYARRGLPSEMKAVMDRALAKDPDQRFSTGEEFARALRSIRDDGSDALVFHDEPVDEDGVAGPSGEETDSVADSLMREARSTKEIQIHLKALLEEDRRLRLAASPLLHFQNVTLTTEEAFILSRVDNEARPRDILAVSPLSEQETARALLGFIRAGLISFEGDTTCRKKVGRCESSEEHDSVQKQDADLLEIDRLFELSLQQDEWQVLGLEPGVDTETVKQAFQKRAFRFHPDRYSQAQDEVYKEKISYLFQRVTDAFTKLSSTSPDSGSAL
jgi:serine/threonine protein kinase